MMRFVVGFCASSLLGLLSETVPKKPYDMGKVLLLTTKATRYFKKTKKAEMVCQRLHERFFAPCCRDSLPGAIGLAFFMEVAYGKKQKAGKQEGKVYRGTGICRGENHAGSV